METSFYSLPIQSTEVWHERRKQFNLHKTNAVNEELASSLRDGREVQGIGGSTNCSFHSNSLSNKIAIDKLAKLIYILIVVGMGKDRTSRPCNLSHETMSILSFLMQAIVFQNKKR